MQDIVQELKDTYDYSDYQMAIIKYVIVAISSEISKIIILGIFYYSINKLSVFCIFTLLLSLLRINSGGFHCKNYFSCLIVTFVFSLFAIIVLPISIDPNTLIIQIGVIICLFINYYIGPIVSPFRPSPNSLLLKHCNNNSFIIIFIFLIIVSIFNNNIQAHSYLLVGYWTIILHTLQMIIAKIKSGGKHNEI